MDPQLTPILEDYLNAIYRLEREKRVARPRDIGRLQKVAKSTVTAALQTLAQKGLIHYEPYEAVTLTPTGRKMAENLAIRHRILKDFLENVLGLQSQKAQDLACGMEHTVEEDALQRFICFLAFLNQHTPEGAKWLKEFRKFARDGGRSRICRDCVDRYLKALEEDATANAAK